MAGFCSGWMCELIGCLLEKRAARCAQWSFISSALLLGAGAAAPGPRLTCTSHGCHDSPRKTALLEWELANKSDCRHFCSAAHLLEKVGQRLQRGAGGVLLALSRRGGAFRKEGEVVFRRGATGVRSRLFPKGEFYEKKNGWNRGVMLWIEWAQGDICTVSDQSLENASDEGGFISDYSHDGNRCKNSHLFRNSLLMYFACASRLGCWKCFWVL